jgi:hypothetical protein
MCECVTVYLPAHAVAPGAHRRESKEGDESAHTIHQADHETGLRLVPVEELGQDAGHEYDQDAKPWKSERVKE